MATAKYTIKQGATTAQVTAAGGGAIAGGNAIEVNIDTTTLTQVDVGVLLDSIKNFILASKVFPPA